MPIKSDIRQIHHYLTRLNVPLTDGRRAVTPRAIGEFYDYFISKLSPEEAAARFMNYGYWEETTQENSVASTNLMEKLIDGILNRSGTVLDVACGSGATTRYLCKYWNPDRVFGINISSKQITKHLDQALDVNFAIMDGTAMAFPDCSFDNVICVEAAFHFDTRLAFLNEAFRILTVGGTLALTDVLLSEEGHDLLPLWPRTNYIATVPHYEQMLKEVGFAPVEMIDFTEQGWKSFARHKFGTLYEDWMAGRTDFNELQHNLGAMYRIAASLRHNIMCFAVKTIPKPPVI